MNLKRIFALFALALFCLSFSLPAQASQTSPYTPAAPVADGDNFDEAIIDQFGGKARAAAVQGNIAYVTLGIKLVVLDVTDPVAPRHLGHVLIPEPYHLDPYPGSDVSASQVAWVGVSGLYAYVTSGPSLHVIDVSDPTAPQVAGSIKLGGVLSSLAVSGGYAYLSEQGAWNGSQYSGGGLRVVDVRDPNALQAVSFYDTPAVPSGLAVEGDILYLIENSRFSFQFREISLPGGGLLVFDLANPAAPALLGSFDGPRDASQVAVSGSRVFLLNTPITATVPAQLWIIDASQPAAPSVISRTDIPGLPLPIERFYYGGLAVADGWVYLSEYGSICESGGVNCSESHALRIFDVHDPGRPHEFAYLDLPYTPGYIAAAGGRLYVSGGGLHILGLGAPAAPAEMGAYREPSEALQTVVAGSRAYLRSADSLYVLDVTRSDYPRLAGSLTSENPVSDMAAEGNTVYLAGEGLQVIDATDPDAPERIADLPPEAGWNYSRIILRQPYAYVAAGNSATRAGRLLIFDITDPAQPSPAGLLDLPQGAKGLGLHSDYVYYLFADSASVAVIRVSDPGAPALVNTLDGMRGAYLMEEAGGYLFTVLCVPGATVIVWDLSSPETPVEVSRFNANAECVLDMDMDGRFLYLTNSSDLIDVRDSSDPARPVDLGAFRPGGFPPKPVRSFYGMAITVEDGIAYVSLGDFGLFIVRFASPAAGKVTDFHGNPAVGVQVALDTGQTAATGLDGRYSFTRLPWDHYNLTPSLPGYAFFPAQREIALSGPADGLSFTVLPEPVSTVIPPGEAASLIYTDTQGLPTRLDIRAGDVAVTAAITPTLAPFQGGWEFTGHAFYLGAVPAADQTHPMTLTLQYSDLDVWSIGGEKEMLSLLRWGGEEWGWVPATIACDRDPSGAVMHDLERKTLSLPVCPSGLYALYYPIGRGNQVYLPITYVSRP